ncbi:MAG: hypothetical protein P9F75_01930, partial [Candidatus Contendobacter sp.]|nr:hypothetical protein [Candidatus Contendobacter sp.]
PFPPYSERWLTNGLSPVPAMEIAYQFMNANDRAYRKRGRRCFNCQHQGSPRTFMEPIREGGLRRPRKKRRSHPVSNRDANAALFIGGS